MLKVLFVNDPTADLSALQAASMQAGRQWTFDVCDSGSAAKARLASSECDVLLIPATLPDMSGIELCKDVRSSHPNLVRIVVCADKVEEFSIRSQAAAHNYLSRPFSNQELINAIIRASSLKEFTRSKSVLQVVGQVKRLPTLPQNYQRINQLLQQEDVSLADIAQIINQDVAMVAKILQLANSALFGARRKPVSSAHSGVKMLGVDNLKLLVLAVEVFSQLDDSACENFKVEDLWEHCMVVGGLAQKIARTLSSDKEFISDAMTAGTLHDLGKLVLINHFPAEYSKVLALKESEKITHSAAEKAVFGTTHAEIGAYLLGNWSLPYSIVEAVAYHHQPEGCARQELSPLTTVYAANFLCHRANEELAADRYLQKFKLEEKFASWKQLREEPANAK